MPLSRAQSSDIKPTTALTRLAGAVALGLMFSVVGACDVEDDDAEEPWIGEERGALEQVPDEAASFVNETELREMFGDGLTELTDEPDIQQGASWTQWYDRDNPSGSGDYENRYLQAGVCDAPTGVECRTVSGLALWQTGESVSCSAAGGLVCINANQPDGVCNYDYKVRFLCPDCEPVSCAPDQCGDAPDGCGGTISCGPCPCTYNGVEYADGQGSTLGAHCSSKLAGVCIGGVRDGEPCIASGECYAVCDDGVWVSTI